MTEADILFERFCSERQIGIKRIVESSTMTPDYEIRIGSLVVAVEVKQLTPINDDKKFLKKFREQGAKAHYVNMDRPRQNIRCATKQLRAHTQRLMPAIVVLFDTLGGLLGYLDLDNIAQCLYGAEQFHFAVPNPEPGVPRKKPEILGASLGGGRIATEKHNTTLSAVCILKFERAANRLSMEVLHNCYAAKPIDPNNFRIPDVTHFMYKATDAHTMPRLVSI